MNSLTIKALGTLPPELQTLCRNHRHDDLDEIVQTVALTMVEAPGLTADAVFNRARSDTRRFTQDPSHYSRQLDADLDAAADEATAFVSRPQIRRQVEADLGVSTRTAQRRLKQQLRRMRENSDLFVGDEVLHG